MSKELLFSITKKDFEMQTFRSGGAGGQNQNKVNSGVRFIHRASGAVGEARDSRDQLQNKKNAFSRCVNSPKFQSWLKIEIAKRQGEFANIEQKVAEMMKPENLKVEYFDETN
jgi:protein subunit release factor B